jgi:hypothetical protein
LWNQGDCSQTNRPGRQKPLNSTYDCDVLWRLREDVRRLRPE